MIVHAALALAVLWGLGWLAYLLRFHAHGRDFPELHPDSHDSPTGAVPLVTVLLTCKDEEENIEGCVRSVLAQDYPSFELLVVNDRSSDGTGAILERLAREHPARMRVLTIEQVPEGWGGQNHGFHRGVQASRGEWLCFTDADCVFESERTLSQAYQEALAHEVEFVSLLPRMESPTLREKLYLPLCSFMFIVGLEVPRTNDPGHPAASAYGPFMLMRRDAYDRMGGHVRVGGLINGDVALARIAKQEGIGFRLVGNRGLYHTRMYRTLAQAWHGWSRNFYNSIQSDGKLIAGFALSLALFVLPWCFLAAAAGLALLVDPRWTPAAIGWGAIVAVSHAGLWRLYRAFEVPPGWSLLYWPGALFVTAISARAALSALRRTGTTWHGVHYAHPVRVPPRREEELACR